VSKILTSSLGAVAAATVLALVPAGAAQAKVVDCSVYAKAPNTKITSARGMTCADAASVMKAYRGQIGRTFVAQHFRCTQVSGSQFGGQWRCVRGAKAFRFDFKD
jgi:ABC-type molybdate transport system substrate-binding protein